MMGCDVACACAVACLFGESSQQATWPQVRQIRRWSHLSPVRRQSSQPSTEAGSSRTVISSRWRQTAALTVLGLLYGCGAGEVCVDELDCHGALGYGGCAALGRAGVNVASREH